MAPSDSLLDHGREAPTHEEGADGASEAEEGTSGVSMPAPFSRAGALLRPLLALTLLLLFLVGVQGLSTGFKGLGAGALDAFMAAVSNPFLGLATGILATTLVQSSSVTTSLIVGLVASGTLPFAAAVPMVMGANIGTTVTNTIAALAQVGRKTEFRRAFAAATCHDFFNYFTVMVLLPLEMATGYLARASHWVNGLLPATGGVTYESPFQTMLKSAVGAIQALIGLVFANKAVASIVLVVLSVAIIFLALMMIVRVMKTLVLSRMETFIHRFLGRGWAGGTMAILVGAVLTVLVQSSSITTSVMVPLAGAGLVRLWQVFPVTVGANLGTTITALLASMAAIGPETEVARQIALVHLIFNMTGMALFYAPPITRRLPMRAAQWLARVAVRSRRWALFYVVAVFYGVPGLLVFLGG